MHKKMKLFYIKDIFLFERGKRLVSNEQIKGEISYISSTKKNNGIDNYIIPPEKMKVYKNKMTLSNSGSVCYLFFHDYEFVASDHVTVIWIKNNKIELTKNIALYLKPIFESSRYKFNFGREISDKRLKKEKILLPINHLEEPDWTYMNKYIESLYKNISFESLEQFNENKKDNKFINTNKWSYFTFDEIFNIKRGESKYLQDMKIGDYPYVSATANNHGISGFVDIFNRDYKCIVLNYDGSIGEAFYQSSPFFASEKVVTLTLKNHELDVYIAQFLITIIKLEKFRYNYGLKWSVESRMRKSILKLPSIKTNYGVNPNWNFMREYIKSLMYAKFLKNTLNNDIIETNIKNGNVI